MDPENLKLHQVPDVIFQGIHVRFLEQMLECEFHIFKEYHENPEDQRMDIISLIPGIHSSAAGFDSQ